MTVNLSMFAGAGAQFLDNNGNVLSGGLVYTYAAGMTTPQSTYTSSSGSTPHTNPIVLDSAGRVPGGEIWLTEATSYKFVLQTSTAVLIATYDDVTGATDGSTQIAAIYANLANTSDVAKGDDLIGFRQSNASGAFSAAVGKTVHDKLQDLVSVKDFGAVGDGVADDSTAIINAFAAVNEVLFPEGTYRISADVTIPATKVISVAGGASFTVDSGKFFKIYGQLNAPLGQYLFKGVGTTQGIKVVTPEWFGAVGDGVTNDQPALQKCITCILDSYSSVGSRPTVKLAARDYLLNSPWVVNVSVSYGIAIEGSDTLLGGTTLIASAAFTGSGGVLSLEGSADSLGLLADFRLTGFGIAATTIGSGTGLSINADQTHFISGLGESLIENISIGGFQYGILMSRTRLISFNRVSVWNDKITSGFACAVQIKDSITGAAAFSGDMTWTNCQFVGNNANFQSVNVYIESRTTDSAIAGIRFDKCIFYKARTQVVITAGNNAGTGDIWITDSQFDGEQGTGVSVTQTGASSTKNVGDLHIVNNYFTANSANCIRMVADKSGGINSVIITDNWSAGVSQAAVYAVKCNGLVISNNMWTGCSWSIFGGSGIGIEDCSQVNIIGNNFGQGGPALAGGFWFMISLAGTGDYYVVQGNNSAGLALGASIINNTTGAAHASITGNI